MAIQFGLAASRVSSVLLAAACSLWGSSSGLFPFWVAILVFSPFIVDATVTLLRRLLTRQRWREAHRSHAYQRLARRWRSHARVSLLCLAIDLFWLAPLAGLSLWRPDWSPWLCALSYTPLVVGAWMLDAGKADQ